MNHLFPRLSVVLCSTLLASGTLLSSSARADVQFTGTNLAGAEFGEGSLPGVYNTHYTYPTAEEVDYYMAKGMNTFRIPFRWERIQPTPNGPLHAAELARLVSLVDYATSNGAHVILDPHNGARYFGGLLGTAVSDAAFQDFWTRLANEFQIYPRVIMGLMNEPNTMPTEQWFASAQAAIFAIRATGAENLILVPGNAWTGAHSWLDDWYGSSNASVMLAIADPLDHFAFEVHQYLDSDSSGTSVEVVSPTIGQERLVAFTDWLRTHNRRGFLGEFAAGNSTIGAGIGDEALSSMLQYMDDNDDVWLGWTWWAGGPWWGDDIFTIEPTDLGLPTESDRPVMGAIQPFFHDCDPLGPWSLYCSASPNSVSATGALISAMGTPSLQNNDLTLVVDALPLNRIGYFLMAPEENEVPLFNSQGLLCLGGRFVRWNELHFVRNSGSLGSISVAVDFQSGPHGLQFASGDLWHFQFWYRDLPGSSNTSAGLRVLICD